MTTFTSIGNAIDRALLPTGKQIPSHEDIAEPLTVRVATECDA
jgi:hypothetical protein